MLRQGRVGRDAFGGQHHVPRLRSVTMVNKSHASLRSVLLPALVTTCGADLSKDSEFDCVCIGLVTATARLLDEVMSSVERNHGTS